MEDWKEYKLKDVATLMTGFPFDGHKYSKEGIRVVRGDNVTIGSLRWDSDKDKRWEEPFERTAEYSLHAEDIVIGMDGSRVGKNRAQVKKEDLPLLIAQRVACVRHNELSLQSFLYYQIFSDSFEQYIKAVHTGTSIPHVSLKQIGDFPVILPPISTQKRIAEILKSLDDKIENNRRINENLEQQAQALFKSWFVDFEPFKNGEFVESELGMIPKGWRVGKLGEICNVFTGKKDVKQSQPIGLYPFFSCSPNHTYSNEYIYDGPSIIIAGNGSYTGRTSFYFGKFDLYQRTYACTIKEGFNEKIISFLYYMMKCLFEPVKMGGTRGSSIPYIVMNDIVLQKFALDNSLVEKYSDFAYNVMKQIQQNNQESRRLAELRDTLLPKLMSGEININEINSSH